MATLPHSKSYNQLTFQPFQPLPSNTNGRREAYKALITEVADSLMEEDVEKIIWLYDLPKRAAQGYSPLDALTILHKNGKLKESNVEGLENLLERVKRRDLVEKHLIPFQQIYDTPPEVFSPEALKRQEDSFVSEGSPHAHSSEALYDTGTLNGRETRRSATPLSSGKCSQSSTSLTQDTRSVTEISESPAIHPSRFIYSGATPQIAESPQSNRSSLAPNPLSSTRLPLYVSLSSEPRNVSASPRQQHLKHTQSMDNIFEMEHSQTQTLRNGTLRNGISHSISLQQFSLIPRHNAAVTTTPTKQKPRRFLGWLMKNPFANKSAVRQEENTLHWAVKIEQIQKYIYTRRLQDKRIICSKKIELSGQNHPSLKLSLQLHPYGTLADSNKSVTFIVEVEHQKKVKLHHVHRDTKLVLQLTVSSNESELAEFTCEEDFRLSSFSIEGIVSHETLKTLDRTHTRLVLSLRADVQLPLADSP